MAIDTVEKRKSMLNFADGVYAHIGFVADGMIERDERQHLLDCYTGIPFASPDLADAAMYHWQPNTHMRAQPSGTFALSTGYIVFAAFEVLTVPIRVLRLGVNVVVADAGNLGGCAVYTYDLRTHRPKRLIKAGTTLEVGAEGAAFTAAAIILPPGRYFLALGSDSATATVTALSNETTLQLPHAGTAYSLSGTHWLVGSNVWSSSYTWPQDAADVGTLTIQSANPPAIIVEAGAIEGA